jgi:hypothetical protein
MRKHARRASGRGSGFSKRVSAGGETPAVVGGAPEGAYEPQAMSARARRLPPGVTLFFRADYRLRRVAYAVGQGHLGW